MSKNFPKLSHNQSGFPNLGNVDVYKYDNDFDYSRYDYTQMELMICTVPWDMGEVHIGNRTLSGVGNVVYFEDKKTRDEWFDAIPDDECYKFETKFKELHRDHVIDVPVPYDMCAHHNYLVVRYAMFANDDSPVQFEGENGLREWFWFIREVEFVAPNTTRLHLMEDAWQTWIYDVNVTGMLLERGHAPMFSVSVDKFLENPIDNCEYLLTDDVSFGEISQVKSIDVIELNSGNMMACFATTANPTGIWGTKGNNNWKVPASAYYSNNGAPSVYVFAVNAANLNTFLTNITSSYPQFKQTVQGVFFASKSLLTLLTPFTFANTTCYPLNSERKTFNFDKITKSMFGYDPKYSGIAKLYTSPYAHIEITDENGDVDIIKIEDTTGRLSVSAALSLAYPFVTIDAHLKGAGGIATATVTYKNISAHTFDAAGRWYDVIRTWKVPTFAVVLDASSEYDYSTHFDRAQRVVDYNTAYDNATANATTNKSNSYYVANADKQNSDWLSAASKSNAYNDANTLVSNASVTTSGNDSIRTRSNQSADKDAEITKDYNDDLEHQSNLVISADTLATTSASDRQASISAISTMASSLVGTLGSLASADFKGAATGAANGLIGGQSTMASANVSIGLTQSGRDVAQAYNTMARNLSNTKTADSTTNLKNTNKDITDYKNDIIEGTSANSAAAQKENADRLYNSTSDNNPGAITRGAANTQATLKDNADRTYNTATANATRSKTQAQSAITNDTSQAALRTPFVYGAFADGESCVNKPIALFSNIVTQNKSAISSAGDEMLRYGYMFDKQWSFDGNWNIGKYFTYWKLRDFWVSNLNVPDMYMDRLRFFLYGGVTVWREPEDIGKRTVYENFSG